MTGIFEDTERQLVYTDLYFTGTFSLFKWNKRSIKLNAIMMGRSQYRVDAMAAFGDAEMEPWTTSAYHGRKC